MRLVKKNYETSIQLYGVCVHIRVENNIKYCNIYFYVKHNKYEKEAEASRILVSSVNKYRKLNLDFKKFKLMGLTTFHDKTPIFARLVEDSDHWASY